MKHQKFFPALLQGALIGLGAVLPGISGGVLSVIFGIYRPVMELLADPLKNFRTHFPKLYPYLLGYLLGFLGVANVLAFFLNRYPDPSVCLFIGLIIGMLPSLRKRGTFQRILSFLFLRGCLYFRTANWSTALCYCHSPRF